MAQVLGLGPAALRGDASRPLPEDDGWRLPAAATPLGAEAMLGPAEAGDPVALPLPHAGTGYLWLLHRSDGPWRQVRPLPGAAPPRLESFTDRRLLVSASGDGPDDWAVIITDDPGPPQDAVVRGAARVLRFRVAGPRT